MSLRMKCKQYTSLTLAVTLVLLLNACGPSSAHQDMPDAMFVGMKEAVVNDKPVALWNSMPSTYRDDINGLIHEFGKQVDAGGYDAIMNFLREMVTTLKDKKTFVLNSPMIKAQMASENIPMKVVSENYDLTVTLLAALSESDLGSAAGLQKVDLGDVIGRYGGTMMKLTKVLMESAPPNSSQEVAMFKSSIELYMENPTFTITDKTATSATVNVKGNDSDAPQSMKVVKVGDGWVPEGMAQAFDSYIPQARAQMEKEMPSINQSLQQAPMMLGMVSGMMAPIKKAKTQAEFDAAIGGMMGMMGGMGPGASPGLGHDHSGEDHSGHDHD